MVSHAASDVTVDGVVYTWSPSDGAYTPPNPWRQDCTSTALKKLSSGSAILFFFSRILA